MPGSKHDVFISYSVNDGLAAAQAACTALERTGLRCWMAPRDVIPGTLYSAALVEAIRSARLVVLMLSSMSNESPQVIREVEQAVSRGIPVLPVRIADITLSDAMEYFVRAAHWLDAFPPPLELHLAALTRGVEAVVGPGALENPSIRDQLDARAAFENLPPRVPAFTGRDKALGDLRNALAVAGAVVLTGLPGIGKSTLAAEYAYRHRDAYAARLWITADNRETLTSGTSTLARTLELPEARLNNQGMVAAAVRTWLERNDPWLLVVDNADELALVRDVLPATSRGHVIITTRSSITGGFGHRISLDTLGDDDGARMLLRRASLVPPGPSIGEDGSADEHAAHQISRVLGGLPLALNQAGAFIEHTQISPVEYLGLYDVEGAGLLRESPDGSESVAATFALAFDRIAAASPEAARIVRMCAFLAPDGIPEEVFDGADASLARTKMIAEALRYSLLQRDRHAGTLAIHRAVQVVLRTTIMNPDEHRESLSNAARAVAGATPVPSPDAWPRCERLLPHIVSLGEHLEQVGVDLAEAAPMLSRAGAYLRQRGRAFEAERLEQQAVALAERSMAPDDIRLAWTLHNLVALLLDQERLEEAEPHARRALAIGERNRDDREGALQFFLGSMARLCRMTGRFEEAADYLRRASTVAEATHGPDSQHVTWPLHGLADVYRATGRDNEAVLLLEKALTIREADLGQDHPYVVYSLRALADAYCDLGRYEEAELIVLRARELGEKIHGAEHSEVALGLDSYARVLARTGRASEAAALSERARVIREKQQAAERQLTIERR